MHQTLRLLVTGRPVLSTTSVSLLNRLKAAKPDQSDWLRMHSIYLPLIRGWIGRVPGLADEAADVAQDVLLVLVREIPRFDRRREGSFRAWLRLVTVNQLRSYHKKRRKRPVVGLDATDGFLQRLADPDGELAREWDREHDRHVYHKLLAIVQPDFHSTTWEAFRRFALDGLPASQVAVELKISENAVIQSKSRVLKRLRAEAAELFG